MRRIAAVLAALMFQSPARAGPDDATFEIGSTFSSPSKNISCSYYDAGGETGSAWHDQRSEMHCLRLQPTPLLVVLRGNGVIKVSVPSRDDIESQRLADNGNVLAYGQSEKDGGHLCTSTEKGMKCTAGGKGFVLSKAGVEKQ